MGKQILLCTDFSKSSWNAIRYALKLLKNQDCDFYLLNSYAKEVYDLDCITLLDPYEAFYKLSHHKSKTGLTAILKTISGLDKNAKHRFHTLSSSEMFLRAIKKTVDDYQIDMVVMGGNGNKNVRNLKYGENTLKLIKSVLTCPVLIVPTNTNPIPPRHIVFATNFDTDFSGSKLKYLLQFVKTINARVEILSLVNNAGMSGLQKRNKKLLRERLENISHNFNVVENITLTAALQIFIKIKGGNLISYMNPEPSFWRNLGLQKSSLKKLGYFEDIPVLALHR